MEKVMAKLEAAIEKNDDYELVNPRHHTTHVRVRAHTHTHPTPRSVAASSEATAARPDWAEAHYNMGQTYDDMGRLENAIACYETACRLRPDWEDAQHNLAVACQE